MPPAEFCLVNFDPIILSIPIFFLLIGLEVAYDFYQKRKSGQGLYRLNDALNNISCGVIEQITGLFVKVFTVGAFTVVYHWSAPRLPYEWPSHWAFYVAAFVLIDLGYYWAHRLSHQVNLFWTGHVIHHQSEDYNLSVALRQGALQKVFTFWVYLPLAALGLPPMWFALSIGLNLLYQFWIHTEAVRSMGILEHVLNTPSHHRVHHGRNPKYIDKNHAGVFIIWDKMFGTFQKEQEPPTYGITKPTGTFNPVWAHAKPFADLADELKAIPGWADKIRFLFKPPGWYPSSLGGFRPAPPVPPEFQKFDSPISAQLQVYILVRYAAVLVIVAWFLFNLDKIGPWEKGLFSLYALVSMLSFGLLFDRHKAAFWVELLCLPMGMAGAVWFFWPLSVLFGAFIGWFVPLQSSSKP
jgi:alkylglycerol monooxygenase